MVAAEAARMSSRAISDSSSDSAATVRRLWRDRPRAHLVRVTAWLFLAGFVYAWCFSGLGFTELFSERRLANLSRFLNEELVPYPLRGRPFEWAVLTQWITDLWQSKGQNAVVATASIAVLGITVAGLFALPFTPLAARNLAHERPFAEEPARHRGWRALAAVTRGFLVVVRAIPDYVLAFVLIAVLGVSAWPAILALALHNGSILGRLGADTLENVSPRPGVVLRELGASRAQLFAFVGHPQGLPRFLLYFFYRFENCIRDATVLGMLGVVSLGYWIQDARARLHYDDLLFFLVLGAGLVLLGDLCSSAARAMLQRASR